MMIVATGPIVTLGAQLAKQAAASGESMTLIRSEKSPSVLQHRIRHAALSNDYTSFDCSAKIT